MVSLGVNVDHIATLREARRSRVPELLGAVREVERAGADGLTIHLREDRRHIQDADVFLLKAESRLPLNLEMALSEDIMAVAKRVRPAKICLVPERREEITTEGGLNVVRELDPVRETVEIFSPLGVLVSLFVDPDQAQLDAAHASGAPFVELHTGAYANATTARAQERERLRLRQAARHASSLGLRINAGHGLDYTNVQSIARLPQVEELNIGHAIVARAVFVGLFQAVHEMHALITTAFKTAHVINSR